jgi:hypothetical protein
MDKADPTKSTWLSWAMRRKSLCKWKGSTWTKPQTKIAWWWCWQWQSQSWESTNDSPRNQNGGGRGGCGCLVQATKLAVLEDVWPFVVCIDQNDIKGTIALTVILLIMMTLHVLFIKRAKLAVSGKTMLK